MAISIGWTSRGSRTSKTDAEKRGRSPCLLQNHRDITRIELKDRLFSMCSEQLIA
jgi:hypothetical protein